MSDLQGVRHVETVKGGMRVYYRHSQCYAGRYRKGHRKLPQALAGRTAIWARWAAHNRRKRPINR